MSLSNSGSDLLAAEGVPCFALLDDAGATNAEPRSRLYTGYAGMLSCSEVAQLPQFFAQLQQAQVQGQHAVGLFDYELGAQMHGIAPHAGQGPAARALLFEQCQKLAADDVLAWLAAQDDQAGSSEVKPAGIANLRASIGERQFQDALARIRDYLEAGDSYQVNYTYRLRFDAFGPLIALYRKLRASQPVPYGALIALPDGGAVLSFSPELFVRLDEGKLTARPMKGTAAASNDASQDASRGLVLREDEKNRAENLMIVDLLRNDLGRIAQLGSVQVPSLFDVNRFGQVLQMTSTICATLRDDVSLNELMAALFPCGSITGAPKRRSMQIIRELEPDARGLYTGAIGWFDAPVDRSVGNFCLSVPIRTLCLQAQHHGLREGEMGVGAGIVHDSHPQQEYAECQLKARFLTGLRQEFELIETMHADTKGCRHLERHVQRLRASALYFGFAYDEQAVRSSMQQACAALGPGEHRMRLALNQDGRCTIQTASLAPLDQPVKILLAPQLMRSDDLFLRHKTTVRAAYDTAWRAAEAQGAFDMVFQNERGELTEGARSNLFIKLHGRWITPPLSAGVLPGVMRAVLLEDPAWQATEAPITLQDVYAADQIIVCNALRGVLPAQLIADDYVA